MVSFTNPEYWWYPQTLYYASYGKGDFPLFLRATQHKDFKKLAIITGIEEADKLREAVKDGYERREVRNWHNFHFENFWDMMNMNNLDTLK